MPISQEKKLIRLPHTVQIAGALDLLDAMTIVESGSDEVALPVGPHLKTPELTEDGALDIFQALTNRIAIRMITYCTTAESVADLLAKLGARRVQLHGDISIDEVTKLRRMGEFHIIKSFAVGLHPDLAQLINAYAPVVDGFLLDTFDPSDGSTGATGKTHDWAVSQQLVLETTRPIMLAGGLNANNVTEAIRRVRPAGVDSHTGVEGSDGRKDPQKLSLFVRNARTAWKSPFMKKW